MYKGAARSNRCSTAVTVLKTREIDRRFPSFNLVNNKDKSLFALRIFCTQRSSFSPSSTFEYMYIHLLLSTNFFWISSNANKPKTSCAYARKERTLKLIWTVSGNVPITVWSRSECGGHGGHRSSSRIIALFSLISSSLAICYALHLINIIVSQKYRANCQVSREYRILVIGVYASVLFSMSVWVPWRSQRTTQK